MFSSILIGISYFVHLFLYYDYVRFRFVPKIIWKNVNEVVVYWIPMPKVLRNFFYDSVLSMLYLRFQSWLFFVLLIYVYDGHIITYRFGIPSSIFWVFHDNMIPNDLIIYLFLSIHVWPDFTFLNDLIMFFCFLLIHFALGVLKDHHSNWQCRTLKYVINLVKSI